MRKGSRIEEIQEEGLDAPPLDYLQEKRVKDRLMGFGLSLEEVEVFCMHYLDNYSWREIATERGWVSPAQVRLRIARVRKELVSKGFTFLQRDFDETR